ncbi:exosortase A [Sphingomonas sp. FW199]|uniref:exosortase A n=1 Tax=Sphingomonas sp. FW199 TaxID=3400217 RepID=UPI003CE8EF34
MTLAWPRPVADDGLAVWRRHAAALALCWASLLILFHRDVADLAGIYWNSTTFGHCLFVPPILGWLVWQRRAELVRVAPAGWWPALIPMAGAAFVWMLGEAAGVALVRHVALVAMLQSAVLAVLGPNVARGLIFPLAYMIFLVPFGEFMEAPLQTVTVDMVMALLHLFQVPASVDGVLITTSNGFFEVAEACSGNKFLIAMLAYGSLVANVCYVRWRRRAAFMAMALTVPILANGVRAFGTIYAAWWTSVEAATGFDHIVYGFVFFAVVMIAVIAIGWRWFDRDPAAPWFDPARLQVPVTRAMDRWTATGAVMGVAVLGAAAGWAADRRTQDLPARIDLPQVPGWTRTAPSRIAPWEPNFPTADHRLFGRYTDGVGRAVDLSIIVYAGQREGHELVAHGQGAIRENDVWVRIEDLPPVEGGSALRMIGPNRVEREVVTWYRVGDMVTASPRTVKLQTLRAKLFGGPQAAVAILISAERGDQDSRRAIRDFLAAMGPVDRVADRAVGATP